jgi:hypothetical protein
MMNQARRITGIAEQGQMELRCASPTRDEAGRSEAPIPKSVILSLSKDLILPWAEVVRSDTV